MRLANLSITHKESVHKVHRLKGSAVVKATRLDIEDLVRNGHVHSRAEVGDDSWVSSPVRGDRNDVRADKIMKWVDRTLSIKKI